MTNPFRRAVSKSPRTFRVADAPDAYEPRDEDLPMAKRPPEPELQRIEFASLVVRKLIDAKVRVAVLNEHGRPALVNCKDRLYDLLSKDHPIVGIYAQGALIPDVIDDLKAAGL